MADLASSITTPLLILSPEREQFWPGQPEQLAELTSAVSTLVEFTAAEGADAVAYHKSAAALSGFSPTGLTHIEDVVPFIRHLVSDGWWVTGQTILINGGYTTK